jgi:hypothetical protein
MLVGREQRTSDRSDLAGTICFIVLASFVVYVIRPQPPLSAKLLKNGTLKTYNGFPHGMPTTQADTINADLLAFIKS